MPKRGKKYVEARKKTTGASGVGVAEAVKMAVESSFANLMKLWTSPSGWGRPPSRRSDGPGQRRASERHRQVGEGLGLCQGRKGKRSPGRGADHVGSDDFLEKIKGGWFEFDKVVATPDMMGAVGKIGKILGPRGLMPNAKTGTVTFDVTKAVKELKAGKIEFRAEKAGIVHAPMGKVSFGVEKLVQNVSAFLETILRMKPSSSKGTYLRGIAISTTMGPGVKIDTSLVKELAK